MSKDSSAKSTKGGTYINVNSNEKKGHVNIYNSDPAKGPHESIHVNVDYSSGKFNVTENFVLCFTQ